MITELKEKNQKKKIQKKSPKSMSRRRVPSKLDKLTKSLKMRQSRLLMRKKKILTKKNLK